MTTRLSRATLGLCALAIVGAPAAAAASSDNGFAAAPSGVTSDAVKAADSAASGPLGAAFSANVQKNGGQSIAANGVTKKQAEPVSVYMLNPQFVKDGTGPVGRFAYAATSYSVKGNAATVYSVKTGSSWKGVNIATGTTEQAMASKAGGSTLLLEPQVHAYYAVKGDRVEALNASARKAIGGESVSTAQYATLVHSRYASMLPGSAYDSKGSAGGFATSAPASHEESSNAGTVTAASLGAVAALGAGGFALRRRRG